MKFGMLVRIKLPFYEDVTGHILDYRDTLLQHPDRNGSIIEYKVLVQHGYSGTKESQWFSEVYLEEITEN